MQSRQDPAFGDTLRGLRTAAGMSQEALAERAGLSVRGISDLERGARRAPRMHTMAALADALDLAPGQRAALFRAGRPGPGRWHKRDGNESGAVPIAPNPLLGRDGELETLREVLSAPGQRLLTLTGPGGVGKTRLAIALAHEGGYPDGTWFVELAAVAGPEFVLPAIAEALGVRGASDERLPEAVARWMEGRQALLILDNFEHVRAAGTMVSALLARCADLRVVVTSRIPLGLRGEQQWPVAPLAMPEPWLLPTASTVAQVPSVELFVTRASQVRPGFRLDDDNAADIAVLCRMLEGLPLAIELAASRVNVLTPAAMLARFDRRLAMLTQAAWDFPARHQTMRAAIAWSHDLLGEHEAALFRRLAAFHGGWDLDAAQAVSGARDVIDLLGPLSALVDASLVVRAAPVGEEPRYTMLETIREFATEHLDASGEGRETGARHAWYFLRLAEQAAADLADGTASDMLSRLTAEQANVRMALGWFRDHGAPGDGLRLATAMGAFWRLRNTVSEGHAWLETFLARADPDAVPPERWVAALHWAGELAGIKGDFHVSASRLAEGLALARRAADTLGTARILTAMGSIEVQRGDVARAMPLFSEALQHADAGGDRRLSAFVTAYLAFASARLGDFDRAAAMIDASLCHLQALGDLRSFEACFARMVQGFVALGAGRLAEAEARFAAAIDLARAIDAKAIHAATLSGLAEIAAARGEARLAASRLVDGLGLAWEGGYPPGYAFNLQGLIRIAVGSGLLDQAAILLGAIDVLQGCVRAMPAVTASAYDDAITTLRAALAETSLTAAMEAGRAMPMDSVLTLAASIAAAVSGSDTSAEGRLVAFRRSS
jgi:predicted ATPase/DNA-binding XRE family transcriptional regulator